MMFVRTIVTPPKHTVINNNSRYYFARNCTTISPLSCCTLNSNGAGHIPPERQRRFLATSSSLSTTSTRPTSRLSTSFVNTRDGVRTVIGSDHRKWTGQLQQQQRQLLQLMLDLRRTMVMVTKTQSSSSLPSPEPDDDTHSKTTTNNPGDRTSVTVPAYVNLSHSLEVTASCLKRIETLIEHRRRINRTADMESNSSSSNNDNEDDSTASTYFLRVFVDAGGCSGFQYQFEMDTELDEEEDVVLVARTMTSSSSSSSLTSSPRVVTDEASLKFLEGSTLDYAIEMIKSSFVVRDNPNSESACGCGSSFAMKNFSTNPALD
jgi:iron-sulfur cluster assembly accessory protein